MVYNIMIDARASATEKEPYSDAKYPQSGKRKSQWFLEKNGMGREQSVPAMTELLKLPNIFKFA